MQLSKLSEFELQNRLKQTEKELVQLKVQLADQRDAFSKELHDDIGTRLSLLSTSLDIASHKNPHPEINSAKILISQLNQIIRSNLWVLNSEKYLVLDVTSKLIDQILIYRDLITTVEFIIDQKIKINDFEFDFIKAKNLFSVFNEIISNAIKHSKANQICIKFELIEQQTFKMTISDNGVGIRKLQKTGRYGIGNIYNRIHKCKGKSKMISSPMGLSWHIEIPILAQNDYV
jgi:NarL family two-component system sensor histidine kinase LiaS